jgi:hypothetical protein
MAAFAGWIRRLPWYGQAFAWPIYFVLWLTGQILSGIWWLVAEVCRQAGDALRAFLRRYFWIILGVVGLATVYCTTPQLLGPLLELAIVVGMMWLGVGILWRSAFPRRRRDEHQRRRH